MIPFDLNDHSFIKNAEGYKSVIYTQTSCINCPCMPNPHFLNLSSLPKSVNTLTLKLFKVQCDKKHKSVLINIPEHIDDVKVVFIDDNITTYHHIMKCSKYNIPINNIEVSKDTTTNTNNMHIVFNGSKVTLDL